LQSQKTFTIPCHSEGFGVPAEQHFFETRHVKSACDGFGGTFKGLAAKASLHLPYSHQVMGPIQYSQPQF
jgi:hypothetical protein